MVSTVRFVGVDGCPAGWIAAVWAGDDAAPSLRLFASFADLTAAYLDRQTDCQTADQRTDEAAVQTTIAVDIPIGLPEHIGPGGRGCDGAARKVLGARQSAVFAVPSRSAVYADSYRDACAAAFETSDPPRKISKQCFFLFPKIREVDAVMRALPAMHRTQVIEAHPEVGFWSLNGQRALELPKKVKSQPCLEGLALRRELLARAGLSVPDEAQPLATGAKPSWPRTKVGADDILDALVNVTTARRYAQGTAQVFAGDPDRDAFDLPIRIVG